MTTMISPTTATAITPDEERIQRAVMWCAALVLLPLVGMLAVLGGMASFGTVRALAEPRLGEWAWSAPIGIDVGILALLTADLLLSYRGWAWPMLRLVAWLFIMATVYLNVADSWASSDWPGVVIHAALPTLFIVAIEGLRHMLCRWIGIHHPITTEGLPRERWIAAPVQSLLLRRRMALWHVTTLDDALRMEHHRLETIAELKETYGRWQWRWRAPLSARLALTMLPARTALEPDSDDEALPPSNPHPPTPPAGGKTPSARRRRTRTPARTAEVDPALLAAAQAVVTQASQQGVQLNQTTLGEQLRRDGHTIANHRLPHLAAQVGLRPAGKTTTANGMAGATPVAQARS